MVRVGGQSRNSGAFLTLLFLSLEFFFEEIGDILKLGFVGRV